MQTVKNQLDLTDWNFYLDLNQKYIIGSKFPDDMLYVDIGSLWVFIHRANGKIHPCWAKHSYQHQCSCQARASSLTYARVL